MNACSNENEYERLPDLYQRWVAELLPGGIPREREANCFDCAMCDHGTGAPAPEMGFFHPVTKCCTYFPEVPNFLAGRAMTGNTGGAAALRAFVDGDGGPGAIATLFSVRPNQKIDTVYNHHREELFGRDPELKCPYAITTDPAVGPLCGIWQHRNSVCSTWFCKHERGATGFRFWYVLQGLLGSLEWSLAWWAITEILDDPAAVLAPASRQVSRRNKVEIDPDAWRQWPGTRASFYQECAAAVERLSAREALEIGGMEVRIHLLKVLACYDDLVDNDPPDRLRLAGFNVLTRDDRRALLRGARSAEPIEAPAVLLAVLHYFDGRPTSEVLAAIQHQTRIQLSPGLVRRLYDFGILQRSEDISESGSER